MADQRRNNRMRELFGAIGDRVVVDGGDLVRPIGENVRRPFEGIAWGLRRAVVWPLLDRVSVIGGPARTLSLGAVVLLAAAAGVGALLWAAPDGPNIAARLEAPNSPLAVSRPPSDRPAGPTLHGAIPVFGREPGEGASVDAAKAV